MLKLKLFLTQKRQIHSILVLQSLDNCHSNSLTQRIPGGSCDNSKVCIVIIMKMFVLALFFVYHYQERLLLFSYKTRGVETIVEELIIHARST